MKQLILLGFLVFFSFSIALTSWAKEITIGVDEPAYRSQLEQSLRRVRESYLKLPKRNITYADVEGLESDVKDLERVVGNIHLGNFSITEITRPLKRLDKAFRQLKRKAKYSQSAVSEIRHWCNYLLKEPITHTFLAKDDVIQAQIALKEKRFEAAKSFLKRAADHLLKIRKRIPVKLAGPIRRIESELSIFYTASVREEIIEKKKERGVLRQISKSFETYHDSVFNMWSDIPPYERY